MYSVDRTPYTNSQSAGHEASTAKQKRKPNRILATTKKISPVYHSLELEGFGAFGITMFPVYSEQEKVKLIPRHPHPNSRIWAEQ